jgi:ribosome-associated heat shock protein Hsp15
VRIDKLLFFLRLTKSRAIAQTIAETGHIRINGRRIDRAHQKVAIGDLLTLPHGQGVRVIRLLALPTRRGPAPEAQSCYLALDADSDFPLAALQRTTAAEGDLQP